MENLFLALANKRIKSLTHNKTLDILCIQVTEEKPILSLEKGWCV